MFQFNYKLLFIHFITFICLIIGGACLCSKTVYAAMSIDDYSYSKIYNALPEKYRTDEFIYKSSDDVALISFATYKNSDYKTSVKKKKDNNEFLYCIDHNNKIEFTDNYDLNPDYFNKDLRVRLAIVFYNGPQTWKDKASSTFTTGNFILDYYMTQIVTHALIYEYGGERSNQGINFDEITFKDNTGSLKKKTTAFYNYCCRAMLQYDDGFFQSIDFEFNELTDPYFYMDGDNMISPVISCRVGENNADVTSYSRRLIDTVPFTEDIAIHTTDSTYSSDFTLSFAKDNLKLFDAGMHSIELDQNVIFDRKLAALWYCTNFEFTDTTQELGNLMGRTFEAYDHIQLQVLVGKLYLYKTDSVTAETISDAEFEVLQYNEATKEYEFYCKMKYNPKVEGFESENLYLSTTNKGGQFKVVETSPGANYLLDWDGHCFKVTPKEYIHELHVENQPILGSLTLKKRGEQWSYEDSQFIRNNKIDLPNVKFELYAKEDIYVKNKVMFPKNKKIVDFVTDDKGVAKVDDLPMGNYYVKEIQTLDGYILDSTLMDFSITRDENRKYSEASLVAINKLNTCQIHIFKHYYDEQDTEHKKPIPLSGARFGLYLKNDLCDILGNVILKKDSCVAQKISDENGNVIFDHLPHTEYYIKELEAPSNYVLNDGVVSVTLDDFQYDAAKKMYICKKNIVNKKQRLNLCIEKTGESFVSTIQTEGEYGQYHTYVIGDTHLENVTFALHDANKQLIDTQTTDNSGKAYFTDLIPGTYYLSEVSAPAEYKLLQIEEDITLQIDNKEYSEFVPVIFEKQFFDELCNVSIQLKKEGERVYVEDSRLQYDSIPLENVVFGIYQNFDYEFPNQGGTLFADSCVGYIVTDANGLGTYNNKLPCGNYYLMELVTNDNYSLDQTKHYFDVTTNSNQDIEVQLNDNNTFYNELSKASVKIVKTDADTGKTLKNVEFTLYNSQHQVIGVYKTNRKGIIYVENLPYGEYYFVETKSKNGYYSSNNKYHFELNSSDMITLNITNSPILQLGFEENYKTALLVTCIISVIFFFIAIISYHVAKSKANEEV